MKTDLVGRRLGDFEVIRVLGRGGMGVVFEARQVSLNRCVALKVLGPGLGLTPTAVARFHREAEAAAKLHHTNIVPVYATGEADGIHFYAMELINGPSLDAVIRQLRDGQPAAQPELPPNLAATGDYVPNSTPTPTGSASGIASSSAERYDRAAAMIADVADALHHAHLNGVTHRDIKPSNLLLSADGRLSVTDFGLARMLEQPGMTVTGEFVGTPAYMSPEQITAGRVPVDHRTDLYSLGATLYELLTLRPPFIADGRDMLLALVIQKEPPLPRRVNPKVPRDLETICLKCLEKDPDRRYQSAKDLADDLRRYVNRFAILARRAGPITKLKKWVKRNPAVAAACAVVLVVVAAAVVMGYQRHELIEQRIADEQRHEEEVRAERLRAAMDRALTETMAGRLQEADAAIRDAEQLNATTADIRRVKGQIALLRKDYQTAIDELTQATRLRPDGVAEWALLATAYYGPGDETNYLRIVADHLEGCTPRTAEDYLYLGQALAIWDPVRGLPFMQKAVAMRDGAIPRSLRGKALCNLALISENTDLIEKGVIDIRIAREFLGDKNVMAVCESLLSHTTAGLVWEAADQPARCRESWNLAKADSELLTQYPNNSSAVLARCNYLRLSGQDEGPVLRAAAHLRTNSHLAVFNAAEVYRRGDAEEIRSAIRWLDEAEKANPNNEPIYTCRMFLLSDLGEQGRVQAQVEYDRFIRRFQEPVARAFATSALMLCGQVEDARTAYDELRKKQFPLAFREAYTAICDNLAGQPVSETKVMGLAQTDRAVRVEACFFLGLRQLSVGDRKGAERLFAEGAGRYRCPEYMATSLCMALLARMKKDPNWPPWIKNPKK